MNKLPWNCVMAHAYCKVCMNNTMHDVSNGEIVKGSCQICKESDDRPTFHQRDNWHKRTFADAVNSKLKIFNKHVHKLQPDSQWSISDDLDRLLHQTREELTTMLPSGNNPAAPKKDGIPTLTNEALSTTAKKVRVLGIRAIDGRFGKQIKAKLAIDGTMYFWYLPLNSQQWETLKSKFGLDENDYVGVDILLTLERDEFEEKYYIVVDFPKVGKK